MRRAPLLVLVLALTAAGSRSAGASPPSAGAGGQSATGDVERAARAIDAMLVAPCCFSQTVSIHESAAADEVRRDVRARLSAGATRQQILDAYVDRYGTRILAVPPAVGFDVTLYAMPLVVFLASAGLGVLALRRFTRRAPTGPDDPPESAGGDAGSAAEEARLDDELRDLD